MTVSLITHLLSKVEINDVEDVVVTEIQTDDDGYVRDVRFMGLGAGSSSPVAILTVRIKATDKENLELTIPSNVNY